MCENAHKKRVIEFILLKSLAKRFARRFRTAKNRRSVFAVCWRAVKIKIVFARNAVLKLIQKNRIEKINLDKPVKNKILAALPAAEFRRAAANLELIELSFGETLRSPNERIERIYFPNDALVSLFAVEDETMLEAALIGDEGVVGLPVFLDQKISPHLTVVRGAGTAWRMTTDDFLKEIARSPALLGLLNAYANFLLTQMSQTLICNRLHYTEARLASLLLIMQDRTHGERLESKQDFLAKILGVRREAVTKAAGVLQQQRLISYSRGSITIVNRAGLEAICCRCYRALNEQRRIFFQTQTLSETAKPAQNF